MKAIEKDEKSNKSSINRDSVQEIEDAEKLLINS